MLKVYVNEKDQAIFICPYCGFGKRFDASPLKQKQKNVKIKCKCGKPSEVHIEFRGFIRKRVKLIGVCTAGKLKKELNVLIRDLSMQGIGIEFLFGDKKQLKMLQVGSIFHIKFKLDDKQKTNITRSCVIRSINGLKVGAEFNDENYTKQLGFYLMDYHLKIPIAS